MKVPGEKFPQADDPYTLCYEKVRKFIDLHTVKGGIPIHIDGKKKHNQLYCFHHRKSNANIIEHFLPSYGLPPGVYMCGGVYNDISNHCFVLVAKAPTKTRPAARGVRWR